MRRAVMNCLGQRSGLLRATGLLLAALLSACGGGSSSSSSSNNDLQLPLPAEQRQAVLRLPVVVHVLYRDEQTNISDEQIQSQLAATNQHLRALNSAELATVPEVYQPYIADARIELVLADKDPQGQPSTGITRTLYLDPVDGSCDYCTGTAAQWDPSRYINIWVGEYSTRTGRLAALGSAVAGPSSARERWGITVEYRLFGTVGWLHEDYAQGKTLTHELGHYLGLLGHIQLGDGHRLYSCDGLPDTSCSNSELTMSFMRTLQPDAELKMFSRSQADIMRHTLLNGYLQGLAQLQPQQQPQ